MRYHSILLVFIFVLGRLVAEDSYSLQTRPAYDTTTNPPTPLLSTLVIVNGKPTDEGTILVDPRSTDPKNYKVWATKDGNPTEVPLDSVMATDTPYTSVFLLKPKPEHKIDPNSKYHVVVGTNTWRTRDGSSYSGPTIANPTDPDWTNFNQKYLLEQYTSSNSIKLESGDPSGTVTAKFGFSTADDPLDGLNNGDWHFAFEGEAGLTFDKDKRREFMNSLDAEVSGFYRTPWPSNPSSMIRVFGDIGFQAEVNSDQVFENADFAGGGFARVILGNPITDFLSSHVLFGGGPTATLSPIFEIKYQGVATLADDNTRALDVGSQRLTAGAYWSWPLARDRTWFSGFGIKTHYDLDLVMDFEATYDIEQSEWTNNSSTSLELSPAPGSGTGLPSFTLSYVQGEVKPTFENFDALLAGIKFKF